MNQFIGQSTFRKLIQLAESNQVIKHTRTDGKIWFMIPYDSDRNILIIEDGKLTQKFSAKYLTHDTNNELVGLKELPEIVFDFEF